MTTRLTRYCLFAATTTFLAACSSPPPRAPEGTPPSKYYLNDGPMKGITQEMVDALPEPVPQREPLSKWAKRPYEVLGRKFTPMTELAPYTVRAKPGAPVSAPCTWEEVERGTVDPGTFTVRDMPERIEKVGDLWGDMKRRGRSLKTPIAKLRALRGG